jgi:hypothetical protein
MTGGVLPWCLPKGAGRMVRALLRTARPVCPAVTDNATFPPSGIAADLLKEC